MAIHIHMLYLRSIVVLYTYSRIFSMDTYLIRYVHKYLQDLYENNYKTEYEMILKIEK